MLPKIAQCIKKSFVKDNIGKYLQYIDLYLYFLNIDWIWYELSKEHVHSTNMWTKRTLRASACFHKSHQGGTRTFTVYKNL